MSDNGWLAAISVADLNGLTEKRKLLRSCRAVGVAPFLLSLRVLDQ